MISAIFNTTKKSNEIVKLRTGVSAKDFFAKLLTWLNEGNKKIKLQQITEYYQKLPYASYEKDYDVLKTYIAEQVDKIEKANPDDLASDNPKENIKILTDIQIAMLRTAPVNAKTCTML